jgi:hypothetical protein
MRNRTGKFFINAIAESSNSLFRVWCMIPVRLWGFYSITHVRDPDEMFVVRRTLMSFSHPPGTSYLFIFEEVLPRFFPYSWFG